MNRKMWMLITTTAVALFGAASVFAQEATQEFNDAQALSSVSRDDVRTGLNTARHEGSLGFHEASPAPEAAGTGVTRSQVKAELREAQRLGLVDSNEAEVPIATPDEQASIVAAGLRADSETGLANRTR
jgi:hypothetical protein